ncbi:UNVERIFIED_CONTAM: hypothetical protein GTU68_043693 [Idotea baltica]|nr:hypothetical protein [Idotea baltica]
MYKEVKKLNLPAIDAEILKYWDDNKIFEKSISERTDAEPFVFYEGPPSANGMPGIHHVMARTIKDMFCRFQTMKGKLVKRKGGWDTHGLPVELAVEKMLGITKEDIGVKITVEEYNAACRKEVMKYKDVWDDVTRKMGYWLDLEKPYVTFENNYVESLWWCIRQLYDKGLLYKGYTIQPYSPAAGTGLSSHELNQPGCYRDVKDTSATAQFKIVGRDNEYFLAWTTTPWTLPSNTALAVGKKITYCLVETFNPYTHLPVKVYIAKDLIGKYFKVISEHKGAELEGWKYEQLLPYVQPTDGDGFRVIIGDFVTTEDGTGIVHIAPSFGQDDMRIAKLAGIGSLTLVDKQGKFVDEVTDFAGDDYKNVDVDISIKLKTENKAFKVERYAHNYPHCWRTDKPILYYPLDSWFIKATAVKDRMFELNKTINWKPASTGEGRFGNWLANLQDWNLSRSRFWGTPLPIWRNEDGTEEICIGSIAELQAEDADLPEGFDLHKPYVDRIFLVSSKGEKMTRESDLIDVWFDSGAMPYAQWHYPFENKATFEANFPADFIAEGVDQTRGWFYTLHALGTMLFDSVAYKNVVSNGLVQDKHGKKMSKRLGNGVDPFETLNKFGADATRWYIISSSQPWDNLKFDLDGLAEVQRKFFGTLFNTYSFFTLYANIDGFTYDKANEVAVENRPEIDRWVLSELNTLITKTEKAIADYEPTLAVRAIMDFTDAHLSNWYVRLCRKRFWTPADDGKITEDKLAAYQTLYTCLETIFRLMAPIAPFFAEKFFANLNDVTKHHDTESVHLSMYPEADNSLIDADLEERMKLAQKISSMILSLRKKEKIKVRQPLQRVLIPVLDQRLRNQIDKVKDLILNEVNIKDIEYVDNTSGIFTKSVKPDFKQLGRKLGSKMKAVKDILENFSQEQIAELEQSGVISAAIENETIELLSTDVIIETADIPGWLVNSVGGLTVALDVNISEDLKQEGLAREIVNKLQRLRKDSDFNVTDKIKLTVENNEDLSGTLNIFKNYICTETLISEFVFVDSLGNSEELDINGTILKVQAQVN